MRIASNKIIDIQSFFFQELEELYSVSEINLFLKYCIEDFCSNPNSETVSESELLKFNFAVKDLKQHKPIQYIVGNTHFYGAKFYVNEHVLIPRPETEELVDLIVKENKDEKLAVIDIGTGSGCIPVSLKKSFPLWNISAIDISDKALEVARKNANSNNAEINFYNVDILSSKSATLFENKFDIIVSNPPYVKESEKSTIAPNVLNFEPHLALFVENDNPLLFYEAILIFAQKTLNKGGKIYFEINEQLGSESEELMIKMGFKNVKLIKDLSNKNRILQGVF